MGRVRSSVINLFSAFIGQFIGILISFISRRIFIDYLSQEYLGLSGLFTNLLTMFSLVELGVGSAMTYSLYKPLAEKNENKIKSLMDLYKKAYRFIGITILLIGLIFLPFYKYLINDIPNIKYLNLIYLLFVINTAISYFYSYKRSLIITDQKRYIATIYRYGFYFLLNISQIMVLILTKNYILFLIVQVLFTFLENIFVSIKANKMYPYLKEKNIDKLDNNEYKEIKKNVKSMMYHKVGGLVINSTDNILISKLIGIAYVGIYSNYYMVLNALETIINQVFFALSSSIGNLGVTSDRKKIKKVFDNVFFMNFVVMYIITICLIILFNNFIEVWVGKDYLFDKNIVIVIIICFYLKGMRRTCLTFKDALGLFYQDRYKPILESIINLIVSIILGIKYGVIGIFIGTIISTVTTSLWVEPYVLYKYCFKENLIDYFKRFIGYTILLIISYFIINFVCSYININLIFNFIIKGIVSTILCFIIIIIVFKNTDEFRYFKNLVGKIFKKLIFIKK